MKNFTSDHVDHLIGKTLTEAQNIIRDEGFKLRKVREDKRIYPPITRDYKTDRINVELENGIITNAHIG